MESATRAINVFSLANADEICARKREPEKLSLLPLAQLENQLALATFRKIQVGVHRSADKNFLQLDWEERIHLWRQERGGKESIVYFSP